MMRIIELALAISILLNVLISCADRNSQIYGEVTDTMVSAKGNACKIEAKIQVDSMFYSTRYPARVLYYTGTIQIMNAPKPCDLEMYCTKMHSDSGWIKGSASSIYFYHPEQRGTLMNKINSKMDNVSADSFSHPIYLLDDMSIGNRWVLDFVVDDSMRCSDTVLINFSKAVKCLTN